MDSVGTREDLLAAAKQCLAERGYARTTVRDVVAASGANLAAINYHFGTRDKLLNQAMLESTGTAVNRILESLPADTPGDLPLFLQRLIESFTTDGALWAATIESMAQSLHSAELRGETGAAQQRAREGLAQHFAPSARPDDPVGALIQTLIGGLLIQWLIDPSHAPSATEITAGIRTLAPLLPKAE